MSTMKSFELKGNKLSFANFISNLSPCDSPFTSMIGKEAIDQTQYSWQTDSLAPASNTPVEEGSQAQSQTRASTQVITNFTSILRTVASVSDTVKNLSTYGRNKEMQYQIGKAGKEIMRDLEHMNLHNLNGLPGSDNVASTFAGFEGLVAGVGVSDVDTGSVVHKTVQISGVNFDKADLFDMTTNLYLAGSKADKIMFHPKFATAFSDLIANDPEAPKTYRMFDGMDTKYNVQVKKIKDPLGKIWTLIPNRFMPADKFYFFHESDWTQTILRGPGTTKLAKNGSSDQYMIEMEVGLRHRHPYASGILAFTSVLVQNNLTVTRDAFTSSIMDSDVCSSNVTVDGVAEAGMDVHFHTSDSDIISFEHVKVATNAAGRASNVMMAGKKTGFAKVWTVCKGVRSTPITVTVFYPTVELTVNKLDPAKNETITLTAAVKKANGTAAPAGLTVKWYINPSQNLELTSITSETDAVGFAQMTAKVLNTNETLVQALFDNNASNPEILNYVPVVTNFIAPVLHPTSIAVDGFADLHVIALDGRGNVIEGAEVTWNVENPSVGGFTRAISTTNDQGVATTAVKGLAKGHTTMFATAGNAVTGLVVSASTPELHVGKGASLEFTVTPNPAAVGNTIEMKAVVTSYDGLPLDEVEVTIKDSMNKIHTTDDTDPFGELTASYVLLDNSDLDVTATVQGFDLSKTVHVTVT